MKAKLSKGKLIKKLKLADMFTGRTNEINKYLKIETSKDFIIISATDNHQSCKIRVPTIESSGEGIVVVPAKKLISIIHSLGEEVITLKLTPSGRLGINSKFYLASDNPDHFPSLPNPKGEKIKIDIPDFLEDIKKVEFASNPKSLGFESLIFFEEDLLYATDKFTSAIYFSPKCPIRTKVPQSVLKPLGELQGQATLFLEENGLFVMDAENYFAFQLPVIFGPGEALKKIVGKEPEGVVIYDFDSTDIRALLSKLSQIQSIHDNIILSLGRDKIKLAGYSDDEQVNYAFETLIISPRKMLKEIVISFNIQKLKKTLRRMSNCEVIFTGDTKSHNSVLHIYEENFKVLLMPRVNKKEENIIKLGDDKFGRG